MASTQYAKYSGLGGGGSGSGVSSLNTLTGSLTLAAGTGISVTPSGNTLTIANTGAGSGSVTSVSVVSANGFTGTVATATTTPALTLSTSITGLLKGSSGALVLASAGTDYQAPITLTTTGTSGAATLVSNTLNIPNYASGGFSNPMTAAGDLIYGGAAGTPTRLPTGTGVLVGGSTPSYSTTPTLTGTNFTNIPLAGLAAAAYATAATASTLAERDVNASITANSYIRSLASTATAAGTTTLTVASAEDQIFTGSTTQTVVLPVASTLANGQQYVIYNLSTGVVTVQTSGANTIQAMNSNTKISIYCINNAGGTGTASWGWNYGPAQSTAVAIANGGTGSTTQNFVDLSTTQTVAGVKTFSSGPTFSTAPTVSTLTTAGVLLNSGAGLVSSSAGPLAVVNGGTGSVTALTQWGVKYAASTTAEASTAQGGVNTVLTGNGAAAPTFSNPATGSYASAYFGNASSWSTSSATFVDATNAGGNTLTIRKSSGLSLAAASSAICGVTFTPANSSAVYLISANVSVGVGAATTMAYQLTDGTTVITSGALSSSAGQNINAPLSGVYAPATASAVTVKIQLALTGGTSCAIAPGTTLAQSVEWTVLRIF